MNGNPIGHAANPIIGFRLPQLTARAIADNGMPPTPEITIKFFTNEAIRGITAPAPASASAASNSMTTGTVDQLYTGIVILSTTPNGEDQMELYIDFTNFSSVTPDTIIGPNGSLLSTSTPYCTLIKQ